MNEHYAITVAICVHNGGKYIRNTIESLAHQTLRKICILIVDDGSTDDTLSIVELYQNAGWSNFEVVSMPENKGTAYCRNFALHHCC